jgi:hypothetical protein
LGRSLDGIERLRSGDAGTASFAVLAVLLLVMFTYSMAVMEGGPWTEGAGSPSSLVEAEEELTAFLRAAMDVAMERTLPRSSMEAGVGPGDVLDALLSGYVRTHIPSRAGGWDVHLVDVGAGLPDLPFRVDDDGAPSVVLVPQADAQVDLIGADNGPPVRLGVRVQATGDSWGRVVERAERIVDGLVDPSGAMALAARDLLWQGAQSMAFTGEMDPDALMSKRDVTGALVNVVDGMATGVALGPPPPPVLDLAGIVRQSVEGIVGRNLGWVDGYLLGSDGASLLGDGVRSLVARAAAGVTVGALEALLAGGLSVVEGEDLETAVVLGLSVIDELERTLAGDGGEALAREARTRLEGVVPGLPDPLLGVLVDALVDVGSVIGRLGLVCARDALLSAASLGSHVGGGLPWDDAGGDGLAVHLENLSVTTDWSGRKVTEPPGLLTGGARDVGLGTLPYTATCAVSVLGTAVLRVATTGATGGPLRASWRVPVDLGLRVDVVTGRSLEGVGYAPSATLSKDLGKLAEAVWAEAAGSLGWLTARFRDAAEAVGSWTVSLGEDMRGSLMTGSAYTLSRALWGIGDSLVDNRTGEALNGTWDLLVDLFGDDLREAMTWELDVLGSALVVSVDPMRQRLRVGLSKAWISLNVSVHRLCDPHPPFSARPVEGYYWGVFGEARLDRGDAQALLHFDPLTLDRESVLTMEVAWGNGSDGGRAVVEALEARKLGKAWKVSLADLSGAGWLLSMAGGGMVDAGLALHGDLAAEGAARKMLERALKDAWLATMRGWRVGDLLGETGKGPDIGTFLQTLMRELHGALVERGERLLSDIEVYVEASFPTPGWPSVRLSLVLTEPLEALLPLAVWVRRALEPLLGGVLSGSLEGATDAMSTWLAEHLRVRFDLAWTVDVPGWLSTRGIEGMPDTVGLVVRGQVNVAGLAAVAGRSWGRWEGSMEVMLRGVPGALLALVPGMGSTKWGWAEVTLVRVTVRQVVSPRLLLSQVLYDARGRDSDLEFVELLNAGRGMVDLDGFSLRDDDGAFTLRGHLPLLPGDHMLVVRNSSAIRRQWGLVPDLGRMGLRLANDGDVVILADPEGTVLDRVAWEGHREGWEDLVAGEGEALVRRAGDDRPSQRWAWYVGSPAPRRSGW